ncbi:hypothetical protein TNCV_4972461 [Trichonephila clavipes]|nr:hypothetical protein TNCV_4972461 [Trichonephila clavipes]
MYKFRESDVAELRLELSDVTLRLTEVQDYKIHFQTLGLLQILMLITIQLKINKSTDLTCISPSTWTVFSGIRRCGSLVVNVMDSWSACHEFELNTAEDPRVEKLRHVKSVGDRASSLWCGVEVRRADASPSVNLVT